MKFLKNILRSIFPCLVKKRMSRVVWIIHPRNMEDIFKQMPFLKIFPKKYIHWMLRHTPPYIISTLKTNGLASGYIIAVPLLPEDFKNNKKLSLRRVQQAVRLAKELGIKKISVGGFLSSVVERNNLSEKMNVSFFDGTNLLSHIIADKVENILTKQSDKQLSVAIIGATTKSGKLISELISQLSIKSLALIGRTQENLDALKEKCTCNKNCCSAILSTTNKTVLKNADIVVLTTYIPDDTEIVPQLKDGSVFIAAIEPTSPFVFDIEKKRPDITVIKDILVKTPGLNAGIRTGISRQHSFVCLSEAIIHNTTQSAQSKSTTETKKILEEHGFSV